MRASTNCARRRTPSSPATRPSTSYRPAGPLHAYGCPPTQGPLAGIQTLASLIADGVVTGDSLMATTEKIVRRCREAIEQVNELLTLARLKDEGPERHRAAATDLVTTVRELLEGFRGPAQAKDIDLRLEFKTKRPDRPGRAA